MPNNKTNNQEMAGCNVALIKCPECEREVSGKALTCLGCGAPIASGSPAPATHVVITRPGRKWEAVGFVLVLGGVMTMFGSADASMFGPLAFIVGLVVFIVGRFK
jgi:hypothetical protein